MTPRDAVTAVLALLLTACTSPSLVVRLTTNQGAPIVHVARTDVEPVELDNDHFKQALAEHGRRMQPFSVPLVEARRLLLEASRREPYAHVRRHLGLVSTGRAPQAAHMNQPPEPDPAVAELKRGYLQWCGRTWGGGTACACLVDRPELDGDSSHVPTQASL